MAKEPKQPETEPVEPVATPQPSGRVPRLYILLGLVSLVLLQTTIMFFIFPSPGSVSQELEVLRKEQEAKKILDGNYKPDALAKDDHQRANYVERMLGDKFRVEEPSRTNREETDVLTVSFCMLINKSDETPFDKAYAEKTQTIRAEVLATLRASSPEDRSSDSLSNIRRAVKKKINEVLGTPYVQDVLCPEIQIGKM